MATNDLPTPRVYTRASWGADWTLQPYVYAESFSEAISPSLSAASLRYEFGDILRSDAHVFAAFTAQTLNGSYVKIELDEPAGGVRKWHGIIVDDGKEFAGKSGQTFAGVQELTAVGLEWLLDRQAINSAVVRTSAGGTQRIARAIDFNLGAGTGRESNRVANRSRLLSGASYSYSHDLSDLSETQFWSADDIVEYLVSRHNPEDKFGNQSIVWFFNRFAAGEAGGWFFPTMRIQGRTIKQILDSLFNRRRSLGWKVTVDDNETVRIEVFTFNQNIIQTPSGFTIPANAPGLTVDFDTDPGTPSAQIQKRFSDVYDRVIARGERRGCCFTIANATTTLESDWSAALQTAYNDAAKNGAGYGVLTADEQRDMNDAYRRADEFERAYRYFKVPRTWDGKIGGTPVCPSLASGSEVDPFWYDGLRFSTRLPFKADHDYSGTNIEDGTVVDSTPTGSATQFRRPFGIIDDGNGKLRMIDKFPEGKIGTDAENGGRQWGISLLMQDNILGVILGTGGRPQHAIAIDEFTAADAADTAGFKAILDWKDIELTVFMEADSFVEGVHPENIGALPTTDVLKVLVVPVPNARLDWVTGNTVVDVDDEGAKITTTGGFIRDDRTLLKDIARMAFEWYSQQRVSLDYTRKRLDTALQVGDLVTTVGSGADIQTINSVVTEIQFDLLSGLTSVKTQFAELDVRQVAV